MIIPRPIFAIHPDEWTEWITPGTDQRYTNLEIEESHDQLVRLYHAVKALYYAAHWTADRDVDEIVLWEAVRDAGEFEKGNAPKPVIAIKK